MGYSETFIAWGTFNNLRKCTWYYVRWLNCVPSQRYIQAIPGTCKYDLMWEYDPGFRVGPKSSGGCPYNSKERKAGDAETKGRRSDDDRSKDYSGASTRQEVPGIAGSHQKLGEAWSKFFRGSLGSQPCHHLAFELLSSSTGREYISVVTSPQLYGHLWQSWETNVISRSSLFNYLQHGFNYVIEMNNGCMLLL